MSGGGEVKAGDWVVIGHTNEFGPRVPTFEAAQVGKATAKLVYASAHYRNRHPRERAIRMESEEAARLFEARCKSAYAEARRREMAAWAAYSAAIGKMLPPAPETAEGL